jgi:hypothetical protein
MQSVRRNGHGGGLGSDAVDHAAVTPLRTSLVATLAVSLFVAGCAHPEPPAAPTTAAEKHAHPGPLAWDAHVDRFLDDYFRANPAFAVYQGKHEYDGQLPDWSPAGIEAEIARLHAERERASAFDSQNLDPRRRFQREYLLAVVDRDLFWLEEARLPWTNPAFYGDALDPNVYVTRPYAPLAVRIKAFTAWANAVPHALVVIRAMLETPMPLPLVEIGKLRFGGVATYLEDDVPQAFVTITDPGLRLPFDKARLRAAAAFREMGTWFDGLQATAAGSFALGPERYQKMLWMTERVSTPLAELEAMGRADLARNLAALTTECARYAPGKTPRECVERMNAHKTAGGSVEAARAQLVRLKAFIVDQGLVTIPGDEQADVRESPPYMRWNFAYIDPPGPYEHGLPAVYYVSPPDASWSDKQKSDYLPGVAELLFTSVHEVWPGHFLQFLHSNRSPDRFGRIFVGYAFAEGWAHYTEEMMWEAGLGAGDPETHIGQLSEALLRDVRYLASIGMHTRGMTQAEAERLFREQGLQSEPTARQQAARGTFDPGYLNYTLGKLMIRQLRDEWVKRRAGSGGGSGVGDWKGFHDELLSWGGPPVGLLKGVMGGRVAPESQR